MGWLDRLLFPRNRLLDFVVILCLSGVFSYLLTGRQIWLANWGLIDDHEVFTYLGPDLHLSAGDIWSTLIEKTEVGQWQGRFRPVFYLLKVTETWLFGTNVHLWYLVNTACFALFLASIWWTISRFVGVWLGGALTTSIALLSMWSGVWARLGPSEIFGAASVGIMLIAADSTLFSGKSPVRNLGAIVLTLTAIALAGMKETFLPLALVGPAFVFVLARAEKRLSTSGVVVLAAILCAGVAAIGFVVVKEMRTAGGVDFYGKAAGPGATLAFAVIGVLDGFLRTWWLWVLPILVFQMLKVLPRRPLVQWVVGSRSAFGIYLFLVAMYAAQCGLYRMSFPHNSRYDFPAMLLVPLTCCLLACEVSTRLREHFPERTVAHAQFAAALFLIFALVMTNLGRPPDLALAVKKNIEATRAFFSEVERLTEAAKARPDSPIILEARGPLAFEPAFSVPAYLRALGVRNPVAVRFHPDGKLKGPFFEGLERSLTGLETSDTAPFTPLRNVLDSRSQGCLSVGLFGPPEDGCAAFEIKG